MKLNYIQSILFLVDLDYGQSYLKSIDVFAPGSIVHKMHRMHKQRNSWRGISTSPQA